jgi:hypothetical protein
MIEEAAVRMRAPWEGAIVVSALVALAAVCIARPLAAQDVTYADVAEILQSRCVECHRPNSVAPMSLLTYQQVKRYAPRIKGAVENRIMPPWGLNPSIGIQAYKNSRELSERERETIVRWVDAGAPEGDAQAPLLPEAPAGDFFWYLQDQLGEPDLVLDGPVVSVATDGPDKWYEVTIPTGLTQARWVRAVEVRPPDDASRTVVHHALASIVQDEPQLVGLPEDAQGDVRGPGLLYNYAAGKGGHIFEHDAGKLMLPGSAISWEIHTTTKGVEVPHATVKLGLWFYDEPPPYRTVLTTFTPRNGNDNLDIPPGQIAVHQGFWVMPAPVRVESFQPHMHMRGKAMMTEAIYPDGHREVLTFVDNFQWNLQNTYIYDDDVAPLLPKGTVIVVTSWHDNRASNPNNPDAGQWVGWGARVVDEMSIAWMDLTYLDQDYFDRLVAERRRAHQAPTVSTDR